MDISRSSIESNGGLRNTMKACPNHVLLVISTDTDIPSKVRMSAEGLGLSYFKDLFNDIIKIDVYTNNSCGIYESEEKLIIISGLFKGSIKNYVDKHINDILASFDHQGFMISIDKKTLDIFIVQGPVIYQPVFYTLQNGVILVSNDMSTIVEVLKDVHDLKPSIDLLALYELILLDEVVSTRTIVKGIKHVRAGEYIHITAKESLKLKHARYWEPWKIVELPTSSNANKSNLQTLIQTLIETISEYCEMNESTIGVPLSGGLDSTMVLTLLLNVCKNKKVIPLHLNVGSIYELYLIKQIHERACESNNVHCVYTRYSITEILSNYAELLRRHTCCIPFPRPGDAALTYSLLAEAFSSTGVKFVISGDDGDCIWGGYNLPAYYILQLLLKKDFGRFIQLIKILFSYDRSILIRFIAETVGTFMRTRLPSIYFTRRVKRVARLNHAKRRFYKLLTQYISTLYENTLRPLSTNIFREYLTRRFVFLSSPLINTNVRAHECRNITLAPLFASRKLLEIIASLPDELFFIPYGFRSLQRVFLKVAGYPPSIYKQKKSGFSITHYVTIDAQIIAKIKSLISSDPYISKFVDLRKLDTRDLLKVYNAKLKYECLIKDV